MGISVQANTEEMAFNEEGYGVPQVTFLSYHFAQLMTDLGYSEDEFNGKENGMCGDVAGDKLIDFRKRLWEIDPKSIFRTDDYCQRKLADLRLITQFAIDSNVELVYG